MARLKDREKAIELRKQGRSYGQIKQELGLSKSTLSGWLKQYPLSQERIKELRDHNERRIEKFRETMRRKREERLDKMYENQKKEMLPMNDRDLFLMGLALYWGEGTKSRMSTLELANTDPDMIKFYIQWLTVSLQVPKKSLKVRLHLYKDMNVEEKMYYWSDVLNIPLDQFQKPYVKETLTTKRIQHKGRFGQGTCVIRIHNVPLAEKIGMSIRAVSNLY
jgi:transposase